MRFVTLWALIPGFLAVVLWLITVLIWLEGGGVETTGLVTGKALQGAPDSPDRILFLRYDTADGRQIEAGGHVSRAVFDGLEEGDRVLLRYRRGAPEAFAVEGGRAEWLESALFGLVLSGALGGWIWFAGGRAQSALRAVREGEVRQARVTEHAGTGVTVNGKARFRLVWRDATARRGQSRLVDAETLRAHPVGSLLVVYADPDSNRVWWEHDLD